MEIFTNYYDSYVLELVCKINLFSSKRRRLYSRRIYDAYETLLGEIGRLEPLLRTGNTQMYNRLVGIPKFGLLVYGYVNLFAEPFCGIYFSLKGVDCIHHKYTILMQHFRVKLELWNPCSAQVMLRRMIDSLVSKFGSTGIWLRQLSL